jgi:cytochrome c
MRSTNKSIALRHTGLAAALICCLSLIAPQEAEAQSVLSSSPSSPLPLPTASTSAPATAIVSGTAPATATATATVTATASAPAVPTLSFDAGLELARKKTCLGCHQVDSKRVGPSFQTVAQRHAAQAGSVEYLANAIRQGGRGRWGAVPMPAQPQVNQQDALQLAQWILTLR